MRSNFPLLIETNSTKNSIGVPANVANRLPQVELDSNRTCRKERGFQNGRLARPCKSRFLLPEDFVAGNYLIANPDLWEAVAESEAGEHYATTGRAQNRPYHLPFVSNFYKELYLSASKNWSEKQLEQDWRAAKGDRYGSLHEVLFRAGFRPPNWLNHFSPDSYISYNYLWHTVRNTTQALVHFITIGVPQMFAISADLEFDPAFVRATLAPPEGLDDAALYKHWVEHMLSPHMRSQKFPPNEAEMLRRLNLKLSSIPEAFDWRRYSAERPGIGGIHDRWSAIEHFINEGVLQPHPLPMPVRMAEPLLRAAADRFAERNEFDKGHAAYERYLLCPNATGRGIQHAGDLALREGKFTRALLLYNRVRALGQANLWTYVNGASCAHEIREFEMAREIIFEGLRDFPRNARLQKSFLDVQNSIFNLAVTRHVETLRAGGASRLAEDIDEIYRSFQACYAIQYGGEPAARGPGGAGKLVVAVLANCDLAQCTYYRVSQKLEHLSAVGVDIRVFPLGQEQKFLSAAATADIAIFYRTAASAVTLQCVAYCKLINLPVIYEIDDLVFDGENFPDTYESYSGGISREKHFDLRCGVALVRAFIALCDYGIASTEALRRELAKVVKTGKVIVHRNQLSQELAAAAKAGTTRGANDTGGSSVTIFYGSGTLAHRRDFHELVEPALFRLMSENPQVRFLACGHVDVTALESAFPSRVALVEFLPNRDDYMKFLSCADINIAVLQANRFNDCKSEIKWLEAAAFGIPSVVSDVAVYSEALRPDQDLLLAGPDPAAWYEALRALVTRPGRRAQIGARARATALDLYNPTLAAKHLAVSLGELAASSRAKPPTTRRKRILIVNVFFPPQAIGGATRIVAGQVAEMCQSYASQYEVAVFCGNDEDAPPYEMTAYGWNGVPVYSVNTPLREGNDWGHADPEIRPAFEAVLARFNPDLVHFHAIQRLTTVMIDALQARGIPFVVTVHDAWWISDDQFLIDSRDRLELPWERPTAAAGNPPSASAIRLRALAARLGQAKSVLAVSESFAALYRRAGFPNVRTVANGIAELPPLEPGTRPEKKLRIGHFGGMGYIKGVFLLKRALSRGHFPDLELVTVDLAKTYGEESHEVWGATSVKIIGRVPQDKIGWLYGQIDVLIAPSVWPESFGLCVREAVTYGKWIVVSDRGALPEAVLPDVNGFVIDLNDPQALPAALAKLQADMPRFLQTPAAAPHPATMRENTAQLCGIFNEILEAQPTAKRKGRPQPSTRRRNEATAALNF